MVDLSNIEKVESPFNFENTMIELAGRSFLMSLHEMLSKPVNPNSSEIEYISSQYLTGYVKSLGFDGIIFKSSLGLNNNLVIFNQDKTVIKELTYYNVSDIRIKINAIN